MNPIPGNLGWTRFDRIYNLRASLKTASSEIRLKREYIATLEKMLTEKDARIAYLENRLKEVDTTKDAQVKRIKLEAPGTSKDLADQSSNFKLFMVKLENMKEEIKISQEEMEKTFKNMKKEKENTKN